MDSQWVLQMKSGHTPLRTIREEGMLVGACSKTTGLSRMMQLNVKLDILVLRARAVRLCMKSS